MRLVETSGGHVGDFVQRGSVLFTCEAPTVINDMRRLRVVPRALEYRSRDSVGDQQVPEERWRLCRPR